MMFPAAVVEFLFCPFVFLVSPRGLALSPVGLLRPGLTGFCFSRDPIKAVDEGETRAQMEDCGFKISQTRT
jgi:hypothetical protein